MNPFLQFWSVCNCQIFREFVDCLLLFEERNLEFLCFLPQLAANVYDFEIIKIKGNN